MPINSIPFVDGSGSAFPSAEDDFGQEYINNVCDRITAGRFNQMSHAVYALESHTLRIVHTESGYPVSGTARPKMMWKVYTVTTTGAAKVTYVRLPALSATEISFFNSTPFASGNCVNVWARKSSGEAFAGEGYRAAIRGPMADIGGSVGPVVALSTLGQDVGNRIVPVGTYVVTLLVQSAELQNA